MRWSRVGFNFNCPSYRKNRATVTSLKIMVELEWEIIEIMIAMIVCTCTSTFNYDETDTVCACAAVLKKFKMLKLVTRVRPLDSYCKLSHTTN
jgi:hypothetical protein